MAIDPKVPIVWGVEIGTDWAGFFSGTNNKKQEQKYSTLMEYFCFQFQPFFDILTILKANVSSNLSIFFDRNRHFLDALPREKKHDRASCVVSLTGYRSLYKAAAAVAIDPKVPIVLGVEIGTDWAGFFSGTNNKKQEQKYSTLMEYFGFQFQQFFDILTILKANVSSNLSIFFDRNRDFLDALPREKKHDRASCVVSLTGYRSLYKAAAAVAIDPKVLIVWGVEIGTDWAGIFRHKQ